MRVLKTKKVRIVGLMLVFAMLFSCMGVFAEEPEVMIEDMPVAVATLTDEFDNVQELDVECTVERMVTKGRSSDYPIYKASYRTETNSGDKTSSGVTAQLEIYYQVKDENFNDLFRITSVFGSWDPGSSTLSNRKVQARSTNFDTFNASPTSNSFSYATDLTDWADFRYSYATSSVTCKSSASTKTLTLKVNSK